MAAAFARWNEFLDLIAKQDQTDLVVFRMAENARTEAISAASSRFDCSLEPNKPDPLTSTTSISVNSRSSTNFFTNGWFIRAVTFQSIVRTSSPGWYSRTLSKFMPWPLNTLWYWPARVSLTSRLVRSSICRIFLRISRGIIESLLLHPHYKTFNVTSRSRHGQLIKYRLNDRFA